MDTVAVRPSDRLRSAAPYVNVNVPRALPGQTVADCRRSVDPDGLESASAVAIVEDDRLVGLVPASRLLVRDDRKPLREVMERAVVTVGSHEPIEVAANRAVAAGRVELVVNDSDGKFLGLVPPAQFARILLREHEEDLARVGGYRSSVGQAKRSAEESLPRRLWHRLPWLVVGLAGAMASVVLVGAFESTLSELVLLAFFLPAVVYVADSVGTQTETLLIRALATDADLGTIVRREILTGLLLGAAMAVLFFPFALVGWGDPKIALAVALALFGSSAVATGVSMSLPLGLQRLGLDPAFGSGPLATVVQDLLSIAIYFAIAVTIVG